MRLALSPRRPDSGIEATSFARRACEPIVAALALSFVPTGLLGQDHPDSSPFRTAATCGECHRAIYESWRLNRHAHAATDTVFLAALEDAERVSIGLPARSMCLTCHSPTTVVTQDLGMKRDITSESITCDFCHSMVETGVEAFPPFTLDVGEVTRGPYDGAKATSHEAAYSSIHESAELCGTCHEYTTPFGVELLTTYSEYLGSQFPGERIICQSCHMPYVRATMVEPSQESDRYRFVNLHRMPGGHDPSQLRRAVELEWEEIRPEPGGTLARVAIWNIGAGHAFPTGMPTRRVALQIVAKSTRGQSHEARVEYQRVVRDDGGREIERAGRLFTDAAEIERDNRILPGERRIESFQVPFSRDQLAELQATLVYEIAPAGPDGAIERTVIWEMTADLP